MGAKLSNFSWNHRSNQQNIGNNMKTTDDISQINSTSIVPSIVIDHEELMDKSVSNKSSNSYNDNHEYPIKPQTFPKLSSVSNSNSAPVNKENYFRIHPILQKGEKLSDTHYWFMTEPKHKRCHSARLKRNPPELYINAANISNDCPNKEPDLPYDRNEHISIEYAKYRPIRRGNSETDKSYLYNMQRGLVVRLMFAIPNATEMECNSVLIGANWDFNTAEKRLKVDMLHRKGYLNQMMCTKLLEKHNWDYKIAEAEAIRDYSINAYQRQYSNNSNKSRESDTL